MSYKINCPRSLSVSLGQRQPHAGQVTNGPGPMTDISEMVSNTTEISLAVFSVFASDYRTNRLSLSDPSFLSKCLRIQSFQFSRPYFFDI
jgi:hypothetical protein